MEPQNQTGEACTSVGHEALKRSDALWATCHAVGWQPGLGSDLYEMRNCPRCGSSLLRQVDTSRLRYLPPSMAA